MKKTLRSTLNGALATVLEASPVLATRLGEAGCDDRLDDLGPEGRRRWHAQLEHALEQLDQIDRLSLGASEQLELDALTTLIEVARRTDTDLMITRRDPDLYVRELAWALYGTVHREGAKGERVRCLLARLEAIDDWLTTARDNLRAGYDIPPTWAQTAVLRLEGLDRLFREDLLPFAQQIGRGAERLADAAEGARRKLLAFATFLREEIVPRADGVCSVGQSHFDFLLKRLHGLTVGGLEIARRAEQALAEREAALEREAQALGVADGVAATVAHLQRRRPALSRLLETYEQRLEAAIETVDTLGLGSVPDEAPREVAAAPPFVHVDAPVAHFEPLALLGRPTGALWVLPPERREAGEAIAAARAAEHCNYLVQIAAVREGYPGKALHFAYGCRGGSRVRRLLRSPATIEGWALLALDLVEQAGGFRSPRLAFMLALVRLRAALEASLDVRLHLQALPVAEVVRELEVRGHYPAPVAQAIARRLARCPTHGTAAFVGHGELVRLRTERAEMLGDRFRPVEVYERVLRMGGAPIAAVREALQR